AAPAEPPAEAPPAETPLPPPEGAAAAAEEAVDLSALPRIEDLTAESDITAFLRKGVPVGLRNAALRRVWSLDPAIRDFIGPVDYGWDWNTPGGVPDFVDGIGEGPEIRALAERLFSPAPRPAAAERAAAGAPESESDESEPGRLADGQAVASAPAELPAAAAPAAADPRAATATEEQAPPPPSRPRHGGAMPV
ncbi:DUF3306 domain-containing protein, partial [Elioraea sp. Yellowstone]|uniref:DUF3306 domain-containing protein n=1 Tax=Elioraea sp. Yellowstone TaxID=2592070 RepID=UPI001152FE9F